MYNRLNVLGTLVAATIPSPSPAVEYTNPRPNLAQLLLRRAPSVGVVTITAQTVAAPLARLVSGLYYISESERPFVVRRIAANLDPYVVLAQGVSGTGFVDDHTFGWMQPDNLTTMPPAAALTQAQKTAKANAIIRLFDAQLNSSNAAKFGDGPVKRLAFLGSWYGGEWIVLQAEIIET